jgi:hypothetical protein
MNGFRAATASPPGLAAKALSNQTRKLIAMVASTALAIAANRAPRPLIRDSPYGAVRHNERISEVGGSPGVK